MKRKRSFVQSKALNKERQRYYDAFKALKAGDAIDEFIFRLAGQELVAKNIIPYDLDTLLDVQLVVWCMCLFGRSRHERGPRIAPLCFKDTGDPFLYGCDEEFGFHRRNLCYGKLTCPQKHIFGVVNGGIWEDRERID